MPDGTELSTMPSGYGVLGVDSVACVTGAVVVVTAGAVVTGWERCTWGTAAAGAFGIVVGNAVVEVEVGAVTAGADVVGAGAGAVVVVVGGSGFLAE
jgi:hypothetical protein